MHLYLKRLSVFLLTAALIAGMAGCYGYTPSENLEIRTWYDLDAVRDNLNGNHTLMNDLDSTTPGYEELASPTANGGKGWEPIGFPIGEGGPIFTGTFDGQGHQIRDLYINRPDEDFVALFGDIEGVIRNIGAVNVTVIGGNAVGGLMGQGGTVSDSYAIGSVTGNKYVGGLAGTGVSVSKSYSTGNVTGIEDVGGLLGYIGGGVPVSNSYATGSVTGSSSVGGLVGENSGGTVSNSYSTGGVTGTSYIGGLVGANDGYVNNSFWDVETSRQTASDGGMGQNTTQMQDIATFSGAGWNITAVALNETNPAYIWNIVDNVTYPFLSWQP